MKALKIIGVIFGVLGATWLIASALLPDKAHLERSTFIKAPVETVFENVNNLENWPQWSYWMKSDTTQKVTFGDIKSGEKASYSWDGKKTGQGTLTILESKPNSSLKLNLDFGKHGSAIANWKFDQAGDSVKVTESFDSDLPFQNRVFFTLIIKGGLLKAFETDLKGLKDISEKAPKPASNEASAMQQVDAPAQWVIGITDTAKVSEMKDAFGSIYGRLMTYIMEKKVTPGQPLAVWHVAEAEKDYYIFEAGIPVPDSMAAGKGMRVFKVGGGKAVKATHWGDYEQLQATHQKIAEYLGQNSLTPTGAPWEVYVSDPMNQPDTTKWQTDIYYPL